MGRWARRFPQDLRAELDDVADDMRDVARREHLSGPRMPIGQTSDTHPTIASKGPLRSKTDTRVAVTGGRVTAQVRNTHGLARTLHDGKVVIARGRPFRFPVGDRWVITHKIRIPARPFLTAPIKKRKPKILDRLAKRMTRSYEASG